MTNVNDDTVPYAIGEVEEGWVLRVDGVDRVVDAKRFSPTRSGQTERRCRLWFRDGDQLGGDETQTVNRVINKGA